MARTGNNQRSANRVAVDVGATGTKRTPTGAILVLAVSVLAAVWAVAMMTAPGRVAYYYFFIYAEFYMGVLVLVSLSVTIMVGLVSTDRLVLSIRQRVFLQSTHRTTGVMAVAALFFHLWTKTVESHISIIDIFVPFLYEGTNKVFVGFGTLSGWILMLVTWTGLARVKFIGRGKPWMWRAIHSVSYLMWPIALLHGLGAGRAAKTWVIVSYVVCVLLVLIGLAVRLSVSLNRNKDFASATGTAGALKTPGSMVPTSSLAMKRPRRREQAAAEPETVGPVAVLDSFKPAVPAAPERRQRLAPPEEDLVAPVAPRQRRGEDRFDEPTRVGSRRGMDEELEFEEAPRGRRSAGEETSTRMRMDDTSTRMRRVEMDDTSTRMRRVEMDDTSARMRPVGMDDTSSRMRPVGMDDTSSRMRPVGMDDTSTRMRRGEMDDTSTRMRRVDFDDELGPRSRRRAAEPMYDEAPRGRRRAEPDDYEDVPRQRGRYDDEPPGRRSSRFEPRFGGEAEDAPRARRDRGADIDSADPGLHSRGAFVDYDDMEPDDETATLVDMASRRARRANQQESVGVQAGRGARRGGRGRLSDDVADDEYWSRLRGEAN